MTFFARPNLDNTQFKQLQGGEPLTLSGQTQIATTSGLTLIGDVGTGPAEYGGMYIPIIATGATSDNLVLTYDATQKSIILKQSSASGGTSLYPYTGVTTCAVGGLPVDQCLKDDELSAIIHCMVSPTLNPVLTSPSLSSFTLVPATSLYEVGTALSITGTTVFDAGCINPQYTAASDCRSDGVSGYCYNNFGILTGVTSSSPSDIQPFSTTIGQGSNSVSVCIHYSGGTQPKDSSGGDYSTPLVAGITAVCDKIITGVYPWYWGIESSGGAASGANRPSTCCIKDVITGGTGNKEVEASSGTICVTFGSTSDDYIWFATPLCGGCDKTCWYVDALNSGLIGGGVSPGGELFPDFDTVTGVTTTCWSGETYQVYVSNYQSAAASNMELRNS